MNTSIMHEGVVANQVCDMTASGGLLWLLKSSNTTNFYKTLVLVSLY